MIQHKVGNLFVLSLLACLAGCTNRNWYTPEQEDRITKFDFEGITFTTTRDQFLALHPDCQNRSDDADSKIEKVTLFWKPKNAQHAFATFLDNNLYSLSILYGDDISQQIDDKFGSHTKMTRKYNELALDWDFHNVGRHVSCSITYANGVASSSLFVVNTTLFEMEAAKRKVEAAKIPTGIK